MGSIQKQIYFKAPLEKVWGLFLDVGRSAEWVAGVKESRIVSASQSGTGLAWQEIWEFMNQKVQVDHTLRVCEPMSRAVIETVLPMGGRMERALEFKAQGPTSEAMITVAWELGFVGPMLGEEAVAGVMEKNLELTAQNWKELAEGQTV